MTGVARISFPTGALLMPANTDYDHELVFQEAESYARRHGRVRLEIDRREMLVDTASMAGEVLCERCAHPLRVIVTMGTHRWCPRCAREKVC